MPALTKVLQQSGLVGQSSASFTTQSLRSYAARLCFLHFWQFQSFGYGGSQKIGFSQGRPYFTIQAAKGFLRDMKELQTLKEPGVKKLIYESPLKILEYPDPRLRAKNKRIEVFDESLLKLANEMFDLMYNTDGVGLAAPQVGVNVRLMVYNETGERGKGKEYILVNPQVVKKTKETDIGLEGCLSFPGMEADVLRPLGVRVSAQDHTGKTVNLSLRGWKARIFQHEYDHLEGVLFHDRMSEEVIDTIRPVLLELEEKYEQEKEAPRPETARAKLVA